MAASLRYCFISDWLDPNSGVSWKYQLFYYPDTKEVEMVRGVCTCTRAHGAACERMHVQSRRRGLPRLGTVNSASLSTHEQHLARTTGLLQVDIKNRRHFLKRTRYDELREQLLYIGSTVTVFGRQIKLVEYGDEFTRGKMESKSEKWVCNGEALAGVIWSADTHLAWFSRLLHADLHVMMACSVVEHVCIASILQAGPPACSSPCTHMRRTLAMVKPDAFRHLGKIINAICQSGFLIR